jgi:hypothetical protein
VNFEAVISWLLRCDWFFLAVWIAALAGATAVTFWQAPVSVPSWKSGSLEPRKSSEMNSPFRA